MKGVLLVYVALLLVYVASCVCVWRMLSSSKGSLPIYVMYADV